MSSIISDLKKLNFTTSAFTIFSPNGRVISINKIKGYDYHIEYIDIIRHKEKEIKKLLENIDIKYYRSNPSEVINDIIPIFSKNNYSVYMNLTPNRTEPTNYALFYLPESLPKSTKRILNNISDKLSPIVFLDIGKYNSESNCYEPYLDAGYQEEPNSEKLYEIINNKPINKNEISK